jgi:hypothetical protein
MALSNGPEFQTSFFRGPCYNLSDLGERQGTELKNG